MDKSQVYYVALIDIMGFSSFVKNETLERVYKYLSNYFDMQKNLNISELDYNIQIYSDSVIISTPAQKVIPDLYNFLYFVNTIQLTSIINPLAGILPLRGAISKGDFYTDNQGLTFGKALIEAHETESKLAVYPRIILNTGDLNPEESKKSIKETHEVLIKTGLDKKIKGGLTEFNERTYYVHRDFDGLLYCNYLSSLRLINGDWVNYTHNALMSHKDFITKNLYKTDTARIAAKYHWMKTYHNWFCSGFKEFHKYIIEDLNPNPNL